MDSKAWYVASSIGTFETPLYRRMGRAIEKAVRAKHPEYAHSFIYARGLYQNSRDWSAKWPLLCTEQVTGGLIFFTDQTGWIGRGVHSEIWSVYRKGLPVYLCTEAGELIEVPPSFESPRFTYEFDRVDWTRYVLFTIIEEEKPEVKSRARARNRNRAS